jgi:outer membrane lipoprotein LolB
VFYLLSRRTGCALWIALALAGCTSLESRRDGKAPVVTPGEAVDIKALKLSGRLAIKQGNEGNSGSLRWLHASPDHEITVYSPIGTTVAKIVQNGQGAKLTTGDDQTYQAADADKLMEQVMGWSFPLNGMQYWVLGRVAPEGQAEEERGPNNRLMHLKQQDWDIQYADYRPLANIELPYRIVMKRADFTIRFVMDSIVPILAK